MVSLEYPIDGLDWALFSVVLLSHHLFPLLEKVEIRAFILPRNFPAVLIIFTGRGGEPPPPHSAGRGGEPPLPRGAGRPSLVLCTLCHPVNNKFHHSTRLPLDTGFTNLCSTW